MSMKFSYGCEFLCPKVQTEFQQCSHEEATQLYRAGLDMTSGDDLLSVFVFVCEFVYFMDGNGYGFKLSQS